MKNLLITLLALMLFTGVVYALKCFPLTVSFILIGLAIWGAVKVITDK